MSMEQCKEFFEMKKSVLLLFVLTIVSSTLYVVYLKYTGQFSKEMLDQYVMQKELLFEMRYFLGVFIGYLKKCLLIWILGGFSFLVPLSFIVAFIYVFSYGFSIASLYVCFGLQGLCMGGVTFGIQCMLIVSYLLCLEDCMLKRKEMFSDVTQNSYLLLGLIEVLVAVLATLVECLMISFL